MGGSDLEAADLVKSNYLDSIERLKLIADRGLDQEGSRKLVANVVLIDRHFDVCVKLEAMNVNLDSRCEINPLKT